MYSNGIRIPRVLLFILVFSISSSCKPEGCGTSPCVTAVENAQLKQHLTEYSSGVKTVMETAPKVLELWHYLSIWRALPDVGDAIGQLVTQVLKDRFMSMGFKAIKQIPVVGEFLEGLETHIKRLGTLSDRYNQAAASVKENKTKQDFMAMAQVAQVGVKTLDVDRQIVSKVRTFLVKLITNFEELKELDAQVGVLRAMEGLETRLAKDVAGLQQISNQCMQQ